MAFIEYNGLGMFNGCQRYCQRICYLVNQGSVGIVQSCRQKGGAGDGCRAG